MPDKKTNEKKITISASVKDKIDKMATMPSNLGIPGNHRPFTQEEKDVMFYALIEKKLTKRAIIRAGLFERSCGTESTWPWLTACTPSRNR